MNKLSTQLTSWLGAFALTLSSAAMAAPSADEKKRLGMQHHLDHDVRLLDATWIGTHNSYNASNSGYTVPNQKYSMEDQLNAGFRVLSYDVYNLAGSIKLCHKVCSPSDTDLSQALNTLKGWLQQNPNDVVMIVIEDGLEFITSEFGADDNHTKAATDFTNGIGSYIYNPRDFDSEVTLGECQKLPIRELTKGDVLATGKQVLLVTYQGCGNDGSWREQVWDLANFGFVGDSYQNAQRLRFYNSLGVLAEDRSYWGGELNCTLETVKNLDKFFASLLGFNNSYSWDECIDSWELSGNELKDALEQGAPMIGLDFGMDKNRHGKMIWSWEAGQPDGGAGINCAVQSNTSQWRDANCSHNKVYACISTQTGNWALSPNSGPWHNGQGACSALGNYEFAAPVNAMQNKALFNERANYTGSVWINASDEQTEGFWKVHYSYSNLDLGIDDGSTPDMNNRIYTAHFDATERTGVYPTGMFKSLDYGVFASPASNNDSAIGLMKLELKDPAAPIGIAERLLRFAEFDYLNDDNHGVETFDLMSLSMGIRKMSDDSIWEVGRFKIDGNKDFNNIPFVYEFTQAPVVFLMVQAEGEDAKAVTVRAKNITTEGFKAALFGQDADSDNLGSVGVTYLAIQSDATTRRTIVAGGISIDYQIIKDTLTHNWKTIGLYDYKLQEDQSVDSETNHTTEQVNILEINGTAFAQQVSSNGIDTTVIRRR